MNAGANNEEDVQVLDKDDLAMIVHSKGQFTRHKFSHQTKHFCPGLAFLLHDSGVLVTLNRLAVLVITKAWL